MLFVSVLVLFVIQYAYAGEQTVITLSRYAVSYDSRRGLYLIRSLEELPACPSCGRKLRAFGYRVRHVIADDGRPREYEIQRLRCDACRSVQLWLPDFIRARKYYDDRTIRAAVAGSDDCPAEDSTIRRWKKAAADPEQLQPGLPPLSGSYLVELSGTDKEGSEKQ